MEVLLVKRLGTLLEGFHINVPTAFTDQEKFGILHGCIRYRVGVIARHGFADGTVTAVEQGCILGRGKGTTLTSSNHRTFRFCHQEISQFGNIGFLCLFQIASGIIKHFAHQWFHILMCISYYNLPNIW